jgi:hypothetical protein
MERAKQGHGGDDLEQAQVIESLTVPGSVNPSVCHGETIAFIRLHKLSRRRM